MTAISAETLANIVFILHWKDAGVCHEEQFFAQNVNLWRDFFPGGLQEHLRGLAPGETRRVPLVAGVHVPGHDPAKVHRLSRNGFKPGLPGITPARGRFYPQGVVRGLPGVFPQNILPLRVTDLDESHFTADLNHPLAGVEAELEIRVLDVWPKNAEFGGQCQDWICLLTDGPGLKRVGAGGVDFGLERPLRKALGVNDAAFYEVPRKVAHVDSQARANIEALYARLLPGKIRILDLMAGWQSHLPAGMSATGLGMNGEEMSANPALSSFVVHDLNAEPRLPFADGSFDAVICSLSVEYLIRPVEVLQDAVRVLAPGGLLAVVFSHRWFPDQAVQVWTEMHEFERVGMVLEIFRASGGIADLHTLSERGWPRPMDARDRYYPMIQHSDPVHAVWGIAGV